MKSPSSPQPDLKALLASHQAGHRTKLILFLAAAAVVIAAAAFFLLQRRNTAVNAQPRFVTEPVRRGDISLSITATGNLEPTNEVTVGSELSGTVLEVYVDTNDQVTKGQPLAKLDTSRLSQVLESSRATKRSAQARVAEAEATVKEAEASLARMQELNRLSGGRSPSRSDLDTSEAAALRARASLLSAQAALAEAEAQVRVNEHELTKAIIKSPIDGIVLTRTVEPGQTVAASFTAPELFVIAEKLEHMKLKVKIAEADIGRVAKGQRATFAVDAWPDRTYSADLVKVSYGSSVTDNVVTYEAELVVANDDLSLRPGMTATADIHVAESKATLLVPAAALRFDPSAPAAGAPFAFGGPPPNAQKKTFVQSIMPMPPRQMRRPPSGDDAAKPARASGTGTLWVLRDGRPAPVQVQTGLSDGRRTEVSGADLAEGLPVIVRAAPAMP